jgi:hypothetical protein
LPFSALTLKIAIMPFTLIREATQTEADDEDDAKLVSAQLIKDGVTLEEVPRIKSASILSEWLYAWKSQQEAASAADALSRRTGHRWLVKEVIDEPSIGPLHPLELNVGRESDGWVFVLEPITRLMVKRRFPGSCPHRNLFIGVETEDDLPGDPAYFAALTRQVLLMLTWVPADELRVFGEFQVVEPGDRRLLLPRTSIRAADNS